MKRRNFIKLSGLTTLALGSPIVSKATNNITLGNSDLFKTVQFTRDGLDLSPEEYSKILSKIIKERGIKIDNYSNGGIVEELEKKVAKALGKEAAVFFPTGTLANHIALRKLAGYKKRIIVQADSHIYCDSGDCTQNLSGLNLLAVKTNTQNFSINDVVNLHNKTKAGRVKFGIGVISIESPVRRHDNKMFDFEEMKKISNFAKENKIGMHLDGARLYNASYHSDHQIIEFSNLFDTVYISLYKHFNAPSGAILAGSKSFCKDLYHTRRMFGGGMPNVWPLAAIANHYFDDFPEQYQKSVEQAHLFFEKISEHPNYSYKYINAGTNVVLFTAKVRNHTKYRAYLKTYSIILNSPAKDVYKLKINPSILRRPLNELISIFLNYPEA